MNRTKLLAPRRLRRRRGRVELDTEREGWERRLSAAQDQARAADDETAQVAADAAIIEGERDEARATAAEAAVERLTVERDQARQDLSGEKGRTEQLSERLTVERADLTARIETTTGERDQAQERARTAEAQAAELRGELAALRKR